MIYVFLTDAEKFLLSKKHANSFAKRYEICFDVHFRAYHQHVDIKEECCGETCDKEEFDESYGYLPDHVRTNLQ